MNEKELGCGSSCETCGCCSHGHDHDEEMEFEMEDSILTFTDEEGNDVEFQILDALTVDEKQYLVVMPAEEDTEDVGVVILEIKEEDGEEVYDTVIDDAEAEKVFEEFKKANGLE